MKPAATSKPLAWNTLDEAAELLARNTGEDWTPRRIVDAVLEQALHAVDDSLRQADAQGVPHHLRPPTNPFTVLCVAPPAETEFISRPIPGTHPPDALQVEMSLPWRLVPLRLTDVSQLLAAGTLLLKVTADRHERVSAQGVPMYAEELRPTARVTLADVRLAGHYLQAPAAQAPGAAPGAGDAVAEDDEVATAVNELASLASPAELLKAFKPWLRDEWFGNLSDREWLHDARRKKGTPGRNSSPALFCPFAVMIGLTTKIRGNRMPQAAAWHRLREYFPQVYASHEHKRPRTGND